MAILAVLAMVYAHGYAEGRTPPSHPWSGLTLAILGLSNLTFRPIDPEQASPRSTMGLRLVAAGLALVGAALWLWSALGDDAG